MSGSPRLAWIASGDPPEAFPDPAHALHEPDGLLAAGGDLSPARLLHAYRHGIFPWYSEGQPILWWCPDPRAVLFPDALHISHSLRKVLRRGQYRVTLDTAFAEVMRSCAATPRHGQSGTWITDDMFTAYTTLHRLGYAHSVEVWMDDTLAGGLYGLALGQVFFGESMFSTRTNGSKIALAWLMQQLRSWDFGLFDCQVASPHLARLGMATMPRHEFLALLDKFTAGPDRAGVWQRDVTPEF